MAFGRCSIAPPTSSSSSISPATSSTQTRRRSAPRAGAAWWWRCRARSYGRTGNRTRCSPSAATPTSPRSGAALALAARAGQAGVAEPGVVAEPQAGDGVGEHVRVLQHETDRAAQVAVVERLLIEAVEEDAAFRRFVPAAMSTVRPERIGGASGPPSRKPTLRNDTWPTSDVTGRRTHRSFPCSGSCWNRSSRRFRFTSQRCRLSQSVGRLRMGAVASAMSELNATRPPIDSVPSSTWQAPAQRKRPTPRKVTATTGRRPQEWCTPGVDGETGCRHWRTGNLRDCRAGAGV